MRQIMENDLISREALKKAVRESYHNNPHPLSRDQHMHRHEHNHMIEMIEAAPAVDAVEVVHCCDCTRCTVLVRQVDSEPLWFCEYWKGHPMVDPTDFCSYGERRTDNA